MLNGGVKQIFSNNGEGLPAEEATVVSPNDESLDEISSSTSTSDWRYPVADIISCQKVYGWSIVPRF